MAVQIKVAKSFTNALLSRRELGLAISHHGQGTPKKELITAELSQTYSIPATNIYVFGMSTGFGSSETVATAHIYSSIDEMKKVEYPFVMARMTGVAVERVKRRMRKEERKKASKMFGTLKRNMAKAAKRAKED